MAYESLIGNKNAEKWTIEEAEKLFNECIKIASDPEREDNDFIGEVAQAANTYLTQLHDLKDKFPSLSKSYDIIKRQCEANCFRNAKKNNINSALGIINLKSNHGWTDRSENTQNINLESTEFTIINGSKD